MVTTLSNIECVFKTLSKNPVNLKCVASFPNSHVLTSWQSSFKVSVKPCSRYVCDDRNLSKVKTVAWRKSHPRCIVTGWYLLCPVWLPIEDKSSPGWCWIRNPCGVNLAGHKVPPGVYLITVITLIVWHADGALSWSSLVSTLLVTICCQDHCHQL